MNGRIKAILAVVEWLPLPDEYGMAITNEDENGSGYAYLEAGPLAICPLCGSTRDLGHNYDCDLMAVLNGEAEEESDE